MFSSLLLNAAILLSPSASAAQADLSIETLVVNGSSGIVTVTIWVENLGDAASDGVWVDLYGSEQAQWANAGQNTHYDQWIPPLNPGKVEKIAFHLQHQEWGGAAAGGKVFATVDVEDNLNESDESNNMAVLILMNRSPTEPSLACGSSSSWYAPLSSAPYMSLGFITDNSPFLYCKSRGLN